MTEITRGERMRQFLETVDQCFLDNGYPMTEPAQNYIRTMLSAKSCNDRPSAFITFAESVARHFRGGQEYQVPRSFNHILSDIPADTRQGKLARHAVDKIGLGLGLRQPHCRCFDHQ